MSQFEFQLTHRDATTSARRGVFLTPHGPVQTPGFMPVGTQGTVKGVTIDQVAATGAQMILGNTYHLALRPGHETVRRLGGLHAMSRWEGPILTDSGGFQIFSLKAINQITEQEATFRSHIDGAIIRLTPEHSIEIQETLGSDVAMVLDHVIGLPASRDEMEDAMARSIRWAKRCLEAATREDQARFAIVQGGLDTELRVQCASELCVDGLQRVRRRWPERGRGAQRDVPNHGCDLSGIARRQATVFDGRRPTDRPVGKRCSRNRSIRLCDADAKRSQRIGIHRQRDS